MVRWFAFLALASYFTPLAAQKADPACNQQVTSGTPELYEEGSPLLTRLIALGPQRRRLQVHTGGAELRTLTGTLLDAAYDFRAVYGAKLQPLSPGLRLLILETSEGTGTTSWTGYELLSVSACWLTKVWAHSTFAIQSGPDSLLSIDTTSITFHHDSIHMVGRKFHRYFHGDDKLTAPSPDWPDVDCRYEEWWVWDARQAQFIQATAEVAPSDKCAI